MTEFIASLPQLVLAFASSTYWLIWMLLCVWVVVKIVKGIIKTARS